MLVMVWGYGDCGREIANLWKLSAIPVPVYLTYASLIVHKRVKASAFCSSAIVSK
mgnify:CR=1 FL=1